MPSGSRDLTQRHHAQIADPTKRSSAAVSIADREGMRPGAAGGRPRQAGGADSAGCPPEAVLSVGGQHLAVEGHCIPQSRTLSHSPLALRPAQLIGWRTNTG
jgi:hypothetical protein